MTDERLAKIELLNAKCQLDAWYVQELIVDLKYHRSVVKAYAKASQAFAETRLAANSELIAAERALLKLGDEDAINA